MGSTAQHIPDSLIYEKVDGSPIYYKGYRDYLRGDVEMDELMGSSLLQSALITQLLLLLHQHFGDKYFLLSNELGILFKKNSWRSADLAIIEKEKLKGKAFGNKYLDIPPKVVVEIDTKAELSDMEDTFGYYHKKTKQLLAFGVERVVWIFSEQQSVLIAEQNRDWQIIDWDRDFLLIDGLSINISTIVDSLPGE